MKTPHTRTYAFTSMHSQTHTVIPSARLICPCHTYKELVQQIHELPFTSQYVTPHPLLCLPPGSGQLSLH